MQTKIERGKCEILDSSWQRENAKRQKENVHKSYKSEKKNIKLIRVKRLARKTSSNIQRL